MGISSVGAGSGILTQDLLDKLKDADKASRVTPITLKIANEKDKKEAMDIVDATMTNLMDSIKEIQSHGLFDERSTDVTGSSVEITAGANTDIIDFTLDVTTLATKQIEQSGSFSGEDALVSGSSGQIKINIDGEDFAIDYEATTTLKELKNLINEVAGDKVDATLLQVGSGDVRLFISSADTGTTQDISITDVTGTIDPKISSLSNVQTGVDAEFKFNGQAITRHSNDVSDLVSGLSIELKETGLSSVSITQNRENIMEKFTSFVEKYNGAISELDKLTKASTDSKERGIFSGESTIKSLKRTVQDMLSSIGGGVGQIADYGFEIDKEGVLSLDKTLMNEKLDDNTSNVEAFFAGGDFLNSDGTTTTVDGAFNELAGIMEGYTKYNATLDQFKTSLSENISTLEDRKTSATERLDAKYEILKKRFIAYDVLMSKLKTASSMFTQMANAQNASN